MATRWDPVNYHSHRLSPPAELISVLVRAKSGETLDRVVDLGCGTGLSTMVWSEWAREVVGIDPSPQMLTVAASNRKPGINFKVGRGERIPIEDNCVDIVAAVSAIHWMDPIPTAREVLRILNDTGLFIVVSHDWPPQSQATGLQDSYKHFVQQLDELTAKHAVQQIHHRYLDRKQFTALAKCDHLFNHCLEISIAESRAFSPSQFIDLIASRGTFQRLMQERTSDAQQLLNQLRSETGSLLPPEGLSMSINWRASIFSNFASPETLVHRLENFLNTPDNHRTRTHTEPAPLRTIEDGIRSGQ